MRPVAIRHVGDGQSLIAQGVLNDDVAAYWWGGADGAPLEQLSFLLVEEGMLLSQPAGFPPEQRGWWYCDLVQVARTHDGYAFRDQYADVIVGPPDHPYRVLDLDEYATAAGNGIISSEAAADGLRRLQAFLDRRLNRRHDVVRSWPDFPPAGCLATDPAQVPRQWRWETDVAAGGGA